MKQEGQILIQDCDMKFGSWTYSGFKVIFAISLLPFLNWSPQPPPPPPATTTTTTLSQHKKQNPSQWDNCVRIAQCSTFPQLDLNQPNGTDSGGLSEYVQNGEWHLRGERHLQHHHDHHRSPHQQPPFPTTTRDLDQAFHRRGTKCLLTGNRISTLPSLYRCAGGAFISKE